MPYAYEPEIADEKPAEDKVVDGVNYTKLLLQCQTDYRYGYDTILPKRVQWLNRLRILNNQKRNPSAIGVTTLFTQFQTALAAHYDDRLLSEFLPREEGAVDKVEVLNALAQFDYDEMDMDNIEYQWIWDALFFGRGIIDVSHYDRKLQLLRPKVRDPLTYIPDPDGDNVEACRFHFFEIVKTGFDLEAEGVELSLVQPQNATTETYRAQQYRQDAQNLGSQVQKSNSPSNQNYAIIQALETFEGQRYHVQLDAERKHILSCKKLQFKDSNTSVSQWPIITKAYFIIPHDFWGISLPDLVEDKHRAKAILVNYALVAAKRDAIPQFIYDRDALVNRNDLSTAEIHKNIPLNANGRSVSDLIREMPKSGSVSNEWLSILSELDKEVEGGTGGNFSQTGMQPGKKTPASQLQLMKTMTDARIGLTAKLFAAAEKDFWQRWYARYKQFFTETDKKAIRIVGALGPKFDIVKRVDFVAKTDPDVQVTSRLVSEQKKTVDRRDLAQLLPLFMKDEGANLRYFETKILKLYGWRKDEIDAALPPSPDTLQAEEENDLLDKNQMPNISMADEHYTHIQIHNRAEDTPAKYAHIQTHKQALIEKKRQQAEAEQQGEDGGGGQQPGQPGGTSGASPDKKPKPQNMPGGRGGNPANFVSSRASERKDNSPKPQDSLTSKLK